MNEFFSLKGLPEKKLSALYGKIISFNSSEAVAELELISNEKIRLVFIEKKALSKARANEFVRAIGEMIYNNNDEFFNVKNIEVVSEKELEILNEIIELEKQERLK
ncbi:MAG: hypothetical protein ABIA76_03575 [Candidatus Diapherotrites archaeon]